ncbi:MAG: hypothetical protein EA351_14355 [Gemmatimonadales bacterium]|nr:MAG: hypothetical protein EA351_14355 [Gemmatimonadales bacterium]
MSSDPQPGVSFWQELKERRVVRVALVYLAVAWALVQGAETLTRVLDLPEFTDRLVFALLVLGFPVAIVLAWAFQVTPDGVRRAEPFVLTGRLRRSLLVGLGVGVVAVSGVALTTFAGGRSDGGDLVGTSLDAHLVAVLPFRVNAPEALSYLGAGFMDLLAARLDGEVGPRAIDPGVVVAAARHDGAGAVLVARGLGAGRVVTGAVVGDRSWITVTAELASVPGGERLAGASAAGDPDSIAQLADQVIGQLLSLSTGEYPTSVALLTSTSPEALRAYLLGRQDRRLGRYYDAILHYDRALAIDSTFALAAIARADGSQNALAAGDGGGLQIAARYRDRLPPRDRQYLDARLPETPRTGAEWRATFEQLTRDQPDRIEAWYWLGEHRIHERGIVHGPAWVAAARTVFERALALDPEYIPVIDDLMFLAVHEGRREDLQRLARIYVNRDGREVATHPYRGLAEGGDMVLEPSTLPDADANGIVVAPLWPLAFTSVVPADFLPWIEAAFREARRRAGTDITLRTALGNEYRVNLALGRPARAAAVREEAIRASVIERHGVMTIEDALWEGVALEDAEATVRRIDERLRGVPETSLSVADARELTAAELWRYHRDALYQSAATPRRIRALAARTPHPANLDLEAHALLLEAWAQVRDRDARAAESMDRLEQILEIEPPGDNRRPAFKLSAATILEEQGDPSRALDMLDRISLWTPQQYRWGLASFERVRWLRMAQLSAQVGDPSRAVREYQRWLKLHADAEPSVLPEVEVVRAELARLEGSR